MEKIEAKLKEITQDFNRRISIHKSSYEKKLEKLKTAKHGAERLGRKFKELMSYDDAKMMKILNPQPNPGQVYTPTVQKGIDERKLPDYFRPETFIRAMDLELGPGVIWSLYRYGHEQEYKFFQNELERLLNFGNIAPDLAEDFGQILICTSRYKTHYHPVYFNSEAGLLYELLKRDTREGLLANLKSLADQKEWDKEKWMDTGIIISDRMPCELNLDEIRDENKLAAGYIDHMKFGKYRETWYNFFIEEFSQEIIKVYQENPISAPQNPKS